MPRSGRAFGAMVGVALALALGWIALGRSVVEYRASPRLGEPGSPPASVAGTAERLVLASSARHAFEPEGVINPAGWSVDLAVDPATKFVSFSIGIRDKAENADGAVRFTVAVVQPGGPVTVFDETLPSALTGWQDRLIEIPRPDSALPIVRFTMSRAESRGAGPPTALGAWGSVRTITERRGVGALRDRWATSRRRARPDVIMISLDTLGAKHLGAFGSQPAVSPNIDALLARGMSFRRAYAQYPNTLVSHASLFTGLYPKHHEVYDVNPFLERDTLADALSAMGYVTIAITEDGYIASGFGFDRGFDRYDDGPAPEVDQFVGDARDTFANAVGALQEVPPDVPVFVFIHTYEVHTPYVIRDDEARRVSDAMTPGYVGPYLTDSGDPLDSFGFNDGTRAIPIADLARLVALHTGEIDYLDRAVGDLMRELERGRPAHDTLLVVTADHGEEFMEQGKLGHGETLGEAVLHVPLGISWLGKIAPGVSDVPVGLIDVVPTVLDLLGATTPPGLDGRSLAPLLRGKADAGPPRAIFSELRSGWGDCRKIGLPPPCRVSGVAARTERFTVVSSKLPLQDLLYDVTRDPGETVDVGREFSDELAAHRALVATYREGEALSPTEAQAIDDEARARLRALGYLR